MHPPTIQIVGHLPIKGWHNHAKEVLGWGGVSTCISTQSNNLLQKVLILQPYEQPPDHNGSREPLLPTVRPNV